MRLYTGLHTSRTIVPTLLCPWIGRPLAYTSDLTVASCRRPQTHTRLPAEVADAADGAPDSCTPLAAASASGTRSASSDECILSSASNWTRSADVSARNRRCVSSRCSRICSRTRGCVSALTRRTASVTTSIRARSDLSDKVTTAEPEADHYHQLPLPPITTTTTCHRYHYLPLRLALNVTTTTNSGGSLRPEPEAA